MRVGLLGTGLMGFPMTARLVSAGHGVRVWNRTRAKAEPLAGLGASLEKTPRDVMAGADCVIFMLTDFDAIRQVLDQSADACRGRMVIQMGTIAPEESCGLQKLVTEHGGRYLECPVLGSKSEAQDGRLILMAGGDVNDFESCRELLISFGPSPRLIGPVGHAAALKLALNQLIASLAAAFGLSLGLLQRRGIDPEIFMSVLRESALYAPMFDKKLPRWISRDYQNPNFPVRHLFKDISLFLREAESCGLDASSLQGVEKLAAAVSAGPLADQDYTVLYEKINPPSTGRPS